MGSWCNSEHLTLAKSENIIVEYQKLGKQIFFSPPFVYCSVALTYIREIKMKRLVKVDNKGKNRTAVKKKCENCGKEYLVYKRFSKRSKYCSRKCLYEQKSTIPIIELKCANCGKIFSRKSDKLRKSKHKIYFCSRRCKDVGQRISGGIREIMPSHYGSGCRKFVGIKYLGDEVPKVCAGCGEEREYLLAVHHKDGDRQNNYNENLEIVCHNCHALRHLYRNQNGDIVFNSKQLTIESKDPEVISLI